MLMCLRKLKKITQDHLNIQRHRSLDEVLQSYSYQRNLELDQIMHTTKIHDHESVDLEMIRLFSWVYALCEEERM